MRNIYLIGFMGSGKSTIAKKLAKELNKTFLDLDDYITEKEQKSIPEIFSQVGESGFREIEHKALKEIASKKNLIVATGGGVPCFFNNMEIMNKNGKTVFLQLSPEELAKRLTPEKSHRPLIANLSENELVDFITKKLEERNKFYNKASIIISSESRDINYYINAISQ